MKNFMDRDFLLTTQTAKDLYNNHAKRMPIIDYHCHIIPEEIAKDKRFSTITELWLSADHYKWRLMRAAGIEEKYITGDASDEEKFKKWAFVLGRAIGNPLYHWSHLELQRYFDYHGILNEETADEVYSLCNEKLKEPQMSAKGIIRASNVSVLCTTDDPVDSLKWHKEIAKDSDFHTLVYPAWRPDNAVNIDKPGFAEYIAKLAGVAKTPIRNFESFCEALKVRMDYFDFCGCRIADHGLDYVMYSPAREKTVDHILEVALSGGKITTADANIFKTACLQFFAGEYTKRGWVMQLHYGCKRDNNTRMFEKAGANTGFDCIGDYGSASNLANLLDFMDAKGHLPKTILYSLNPVENTAIDTIAACFQSHEAVSKVQHGSAWWFNDNMDGMLLQLKSLANEGYLAGFVGMLTDSRSFVSYTRHEYFRRILCEFIGGLVEKGEFPSDEKLLGSIVEDISYNNAMKYFGF